MKNIILIISLLFYSFSVVNAQKHVFFKGPWKGDVTVVKESKGGAEYANDYCAGEVLAYGCFFTRYKYI